MWKKYAGYLKQILPLMKNSLLPVLLLGTALGTYFTVSYTHLTLPTIA